MSNKGECPKWDWCKASNVQKKFPFGLRQMNLRATASLRGPTLFLKFIRLQPFSKGKRVKELRITGSPHKAEAHIVVAVTRPVVATVTRAQVGRTVVPATATDHAVRATLNWSLRQS